VCEELAEAMDGGGQGKEKDKESRQRQNVSRTEGGHLLLVHTARDAGKLAADDGPPLRYGRSHCMERESGRSPTPGQGARVVGRTSGVRRAIGSRPFLFLVFLFFCLV